MFGFSGPCQLLLFALFYCLVDMSCDQCMLYVISLYLCVNQFDLCGVYLTVFVNCLVEQFTLFWL